MRVMLLAALVAVPPLAAQQPTADAIRRAATADSSDRLATYRVVADTAWATVVNLRDVGLTDPRKGTPGREVRLERRGSAWSKVSTRPVVVAPPKREASSDTVAVAVPPQPRRP